MADDFDCEAYGPEGREISALCFFAGTGERACASPGECRGKMDAERRRVWQRIQDGAARGDPDMVYLAGEFTGPGQLLGGGSDEDERAAGCPDCGGAGCSTCFGVGRIPEDLGHLTDGGDDG